MKTHVPEFPGEGRSIERCLLCWFLFSPLSSSLLLLLLLLQDQFTTLANSQLYNFSQLFGKLIVGRMSPSWDACVGWAVKWVSGLVPTLIHRLADGLMYFCLRKLFLARDPPPQPRTVVLPQDQLDLILQAVEDSQKPLTDAITALVAQLKAVNEGLGQQAQAAEALRLEVAAATRLLSAGTIVSTISIRSPDGPG